MDPPEENEEQEEEAAEEEEERLNPYSSLLPGMMQIWLTMNDATINLRNKWTAIASPVRPHVPLLLYRLPVVSYSALLPLLILPAK